MQKFDGVKFDAFQADHQNVTHQIINPLTCKCQKTGIIIIIKCKHRKRKCQKTGFQMHASI